MSKCIEGRQILDSILITNESLNSRLKPDDPGNAKRGLKKDYDHTN